MELSLAASSLVLLSSSSLQRPSLDLLPSPSSLALVRSPDPQGPSPDLLTSPQFPDSMESPDSLDSPESPSATNYQVMSLITRSKIDSKFPDSSKYPDTPESPLAADYQVMSQIARSQFSNSQMENSDSSIGSRFDSQTRDQSINQTQSPLFQAETTESPGTSLFTSPVTPVSQTRVQSIPIRDETSCCIFCGGLIQLLSGSVYNKRKRSMKSLGQFVTARCQPTPYGYQYFSTAMGEEKVLLCISCVNWQRRSSGAGRRKTGIARKPMLLMDQVALFMLEPGTTPFPDQRCVLRLVMSLKNVGGNFTDWVPKLLLGLMPVQVQTMIGMLPSQPTESVLNSIIRVWWDYNGRTVYFAHHLTAKLVRRMIKSNRSLDNTEERDCIGADSVA